MSKATETRNYNMADADLKQKADNLKDSMVRDAASFATRNIATPRVTAFTALIAGFDATSTDEELRGDLNVTVNAKDALVQDIRKAIRPIRNMAEIQYNGTGKYKTFGFDEMAHLSDNDLYRMAKRVVRVGTSCITDMQKQGLTTAQLTSLDTLAKSLDTAIDTVGAATETRDLQTQDRIIKGNALWQEMITLSSVGQSLFIDIDEARYNDYVLTDTPPAPAEEPPVKDGGVKQ